jgi:thymidine kinase
LILNFRKEIFNSTARLLLETSTDVFPLTAYCEHKDCIEDSFYTYRYYVVDGVECPALYFDPLVIIGGDTQKTDPREPNYCTRCDRHHYLPGKEYTYLILKPLGEQASQGSLEPLRTELSHLRFSLKRSQLYRHFHDRFGNGGIHDRANLDALRVPCLAERAVIYLYTEQNLLSVDQLRRLVRDLELDRGYLKQRLRDSRRSLEL